MRLIIAWLGVCVFCAVAVAEVVVRDDGRRFEGEIVAEKRLDDEAAKLGLEPTYKPGEIDLID